MPATATPQRVPFCLALICLLGCPPGCQSYRPLDGSDRQRPSLELQGQALLEMPLVQTPVWVMFVIDCSQSMAQNDPAGWGAPVARIRALEAFLDANADLSDLRFGIIRFGADMAILSQRDTDGDGLADRFLLPDGPDLRRGLVRMEDAAGVTDYVAALSLAADALEWEVGRAGPRTRLRIVMLSDDDEQNIHPDDPVGLAMLLDEVDRLTSLTEQQNLDDVRVHSVQLTPHEDVAGDLTDPAPNQEVLEEIARAGGGTYARARTPDELSFLHIDVRPTERRPVDGPVRVLAANLNALPGPFGLHADSDADGLADEGEVLSGTDPQAADTDADGYTDGVEQALGAEFDPLIPNACPADLDSDGDGLPACAEAQLGTDAISVDTDGDGLPDPLELWAGSDPLTPDANIPAGVFEARVQRTPEPDAGIERIEFALDDLPLIGTSTDTNAVQVWLASPGGQFRQACLETRPWQMDDPLVLSDEDLGAPRSCP